MNKAAEQKLKFPIRLRRFVRSTPRTTASLSPAFYLYTAPLLSVVLFVPLPNKLLRPSLLAGSDPSVGPIFFF